MFEALKIITGGDANKLDLVENNKIFILNRWLSFNPANVSVCSIVDRLSLGRANPEILKRLLFGYVQKKPFIKFLKKSKDEDELKPHLKEFYGWSEREYQRQQHLIESTPELLTELSVKLGWDKKTCNKFGVEFITPKKEKLKKEKKADGVSLFAFT